MIYEGNFANIYQVKLGSNLEPSNFSSIIEGLPGEEFLMDSNIDIKTTLTRAQAYSRARAQVFYSWQYRAANSNNPNPSLVTQPSYIANTTPPASMVGIPYCWGGFDGHDKSSSRSQWINFGDAMSKNKFAGNVSNSSLHWVNGTAGLDCSGFVSVAINSSVKLSTIDLASSTHSYSISDSERLRMDIYNRSWFHVVFFDSILEGGQGIYTIESTTDGFEQKVKFWARTWTWLSNNNMQLRRLRAISG